MQKRMEGFPDEKNISAQKASAQDGARFPQENVNLKRPQGSCPPQSKGQKAAFLLITVSKSFVKLCYVKSEQ